MKTLKNLIYRNTKLFFKDKGLFFTSLITPLILLVLYITFLGNVYRDSFLMHMPDGWIIPDSLLEGLVGGQLVSSLLAVCCVTVAFCSNMLMVQDKISGAKTDFQMTPVSPSVLALSYFVASFTATLCICMTALCAGLCYLGAVGWYLSVSDVCLLVLDICLLVLFGTALSSVINFFLSSQGHISAVGSLVSSVYGFVCGAYMPISQFSDGLQTAITFLPGTYGTVLFRNHAMRGVFSELEGLGLPKELVTEMMDAVDCNLYFLGDRVTISAMYAVVALTVLLLLGVYIFLHFASRRGFFATKGKKS